ncbi:YDG domain-containing protein [Flavivirga sp. 57AJ16]|uniref:YDG domain-containing protein n=1 Tax=Flavivirga sp. 57AJ16 TaxID=3025307 RepID=UPI0023667A50|nr:YDG domain-containing protein [Flavivirga sp. 57AJ16]MDD7884414.1 YDG domain-containing protein [Flavivirga sp. 57AJ16]
MKKITFLSTLFLYVLFFNNSFSQNNNGAIDAAGDIAIIAYDDADDDGLAFVLLDDAPNGTNIRFTDEEWTGSAFDSTTNEGDLLWSNNTGSTINAGKVVIIDNADGDGITTNLGTIIESDTGFTMTSGDQIIAFTGTRTAPGTFLAFYGDENSVNSDETATLSGTGLTAGVNALLIANAVGYYSKITVFNGSITDVSAALNNSSNWTLGSFIPVFPVDIPTEFTGTAFGPLPSDTTPPTFQNSSPSSSSILQTSFTLETDIDEVGTIYYVVVPDGATAPTATEVKAGTGSGGASAVTSGNTTVNSGGFINNFSVTGLTAGTVYNVYVVAQDDEGTPNLQTSATQIDVTTLPPAITATVTTLVDENDAGATIASPGGNGLSLREAISLTSSGDTIEFSNSLAGGTLTLTVPAGRDLDITGKTLIIDGDTNGDGAPDITITGGTVDRVFDIFGGSATNVTLNSLNIINSTGITNNNSASDVIPTPFSGQNSGGGISISGISIFDRPTVTVNKCRITGNISQEDGGGIDAQNAIIEIKNSLISENALSGDTNADDGAGLKINSSIATITNTTVGFNTAKNPTGTGDGDADDIAGRGGFDIVSGSTVTIINSTIAGNIGRDDTLSEGDEITITGGSSPSTVTITNSIVGGEAVRNATNNDITNDGTLTIDSNTLITQGIVNNGTLNGTATQSTLVDIFDSSVTSNFIASNALQLNEGVVETIKTKLGVTAGAVPVALTVVGDTTPPVFENSTPSSSSVAQTGFTLGTDIDETGTIYYVVVADGATAPTAANVKAGTGNGGSGEITSGNAAVSTGGFTNDFSVTGLTASTSYDVYVVAQDDEGTPNLQASPTKIDVTTAAPIALTITGLTGSDKEYDDTTAGSASGTASLSGILGGDTVTLSGSPVFTFASANVGTGITITTAGYTLSGADAGKYTLTQPILSADITAKALTVTGLTGSDKVYDDTTTASASGAASLSGVEIGDDVSLGGTAVYTFTSANVGTGITMNSSGFTISGTDSGNYSLTQPILSADITAKALTVTGLTGSDKVYDDTTTASASGTASLSGVEIGDDVSLGGTAVYTFTSANVGIGITMNSSGFTISGTDSGNYSLTQPILSADITAKALTVTGLTGSDKVYDDTTIASASGTASLSGVEIGDDVSLGGTAVYTFTSANVGTGITMNSSGFTISGTDSGNYSLTQPILSADITAKQLTITGLTGNDKIYDGTTAATASGTAILSGIIGTDNVALGGSPVFTFASENIGTGIAITTSGYIISGTDAGNYSLTQPTLLADITTSLGLEDMSLIESVNLYPNPVINVLHIKANNIKIEEVTLYGILGKPITNVKLQDDTVDFSGVNTGIYLLKIKTENGLLVKKIFKR